MTALVRYEAACAALDVELSGCVNNEELSVMAKRIVLAECTEEQWRRAHERFGSVYFILDAENDRIKIGHSRDPWSRLRTLQTGSSAKLSLVGIIAGERAIEQQLHFEQRGVRVHLEWFSGGAEAVKWLSKLTNGAPVCRIFATLAEARTVDVWWEWSPDLKTHLKHVYDHDRGRWSGALMYSGSPNARPGWDATVREVAQV